MDAPAHSGNLREEASVHHPNVASINATEAGNLQFMGIL